MLTRFIQYIKQYFPTTTSKKHVVVCLIVCASIGVVFFGMSTQMAHAVGLEDVRDGILRILTQASLLFARLCMAMAIFFLRFFIQLGAYNGFLDAPIVRLGWVMLRDIANMFFVVALLVIAFATILGRESYEWKKAMVKLVLVAILVNFSLLICGIVLDAAHVFTVTFINAIAPVAAGNLITMFNLGDMERIIADSSAGGSPDVELALFGGAAVALFFSAMAALTIGAYCIILLYRMVAIWSLLIFSPLAFVMSVLPATESYFEEWKSEFTKNILSAPIAVFFLWLAFATMGANSAVSHIDQYSSRPLEDSGSSNTAADTSINNISGNTQTNSVSLNVASTWANMAGFLVAMAFLLKGIEQVQSLGVRGASWLDSAQTFAKNVATIGTGVALGGWLLGKGRDLSVKTAGNVGLAVGTNLGVVQAWKRRVNGKGFFSGAAERAEGRLSVLEDEKSQKSAQRKAEGRMSKPWLDRGTDGSTPLQRLAQKTVESQLKQREAKQIEDRAMTQAERDAFTGKSGSQIKNRLETASKVDIEVKQQGEALNRLKTNMNQEQTQAYFLDQAKQFDRIRAEDILRRGESVLDDSSVEKEQSAIDEFKKALESGDVDEIKNSLGGLDFLGKKKSKEMKEMVEKGNVEGLKEISGNLLATTATQKIKKLSEAVSSGNAESIEDALDEARKSMTYATRRAIDERMARDTNLYGVDALIQKIKMDESASDAKFAEEGFEGSLNLEYLSVERGEHQKRAKKAMSSLVDERARGISDEDVRKKLEEQVRQEIKADLKKKEEARIRALEDIEDAQKEKDVRAIHISDKDVDAEIARRDAVPQLLQDIKNAQEALKSAPVGGKNAKRIELDAAMASFTQQTGVSYDEYEKITDKPRTIKELTDTRMSALVKNQDDYVNFKRSMARRDITDQDRALAYQEAGVLDGMVKLTGEYFMRLQERKIKKFQSETERLGKRMTDWTRGLEGKKMDEERAWEIQKAASAQKEMESLSFNELLREVEDNFRLMARVGKLKDEGIDISDADKKGWENAHQRQAMALSALMSQAPGAMPGILGSLDESYKNIEANKPEEMHKIIMGFLSGRSLGRVKDTFGDVEKEVRGALKEKESYLIRAVMRAADETAAKKGMAHLSGQLSMGVDDAGNEVIGFTNTFGKGIGPAGKIGTGSMSDDGVERRRSIASEAALKTFSIQSSNDSRAFVALNGKGQAVGYLHDEGREAMKDFWTLGKQQWKTWDSAASRIMFGGSWGTSSYENKRFLFATQEMADGVKSLVESFDIRYNKDGLSTAQRAEVLDNMQQRLIDINVNASDISPELSSIREATHEQIIQFFKNKFQDGVIVGGKEAKMNLNTKPPTPQKSKTRDEELPEEGVD